MSKSTFGPALLAAGILLGLAACGGGNQTNTGNTETTGSHVKQVNPLHVAHNAMSGTVMNINMGAMNGSKQDGSANVGRSGSGLRVVVHIFNEPKGASEPAHIHRGTCKNLDPVPWKVLSNVVNGTSTTTVPGVTLDQIKKGHYAINVHDQHNLKRYVSCGDLTV
jgi:hypothetical protein